MPQYRIYLSDEENLALITEAKRKHLKPQDLMRNIISSHKDFKKITEIQSRLSTVETKLDAIFSLLDILASDLAYTVQL